MRKVINSFSLLAISGACLIVCVYLLFLVFDSHLTQQEAFIAHRFCMANSSLILTHVFSDFVIGISYLMIAFYLIFLSVKADRFEYKWLIVAFAAFILSCGVTHFIEILVLWIPVYWLQAAVKVICALLSVTTMLALPQIVPIIIKKINLGGQDATI